ncbi:MAG TPA: hypothetical protein VFP61_07610 [Acidimicrobiales bacterium]|nr:hypothetical protein [Acidimicrobiales bacterium]
MASSTPSGLLLVIAGVWLLAQTIVGGLVDRLLGTQSSGSGIASGNNDPLFPGTPAVGPTSRQPGGIGNSGLGGLVA